MVNRRTALTLLSAGALAPVPAFANTPREITWEELIPEGIPYSEIIGEGEMDYINDTWNPIYDENGSKLNEALNETYIKMPGFVVPLEMSETGVTDFLLVPYTGACIHTPPPPANQLVLASAETPWVSDDPWEAVWVTGLMRTSLQSTDLGDTGYFLQVDAMEVYVW